MLDFINQQRILSESIYISFYSLLHRTTSNNKLILSWVSRSSHPRKNTVGGANEVHDQSPVGNPR